MNKNQIIREIKDFLKREFIFDKDDIRLIKWAIIIGYPLLFVVMLYVHFAYS